MSVSFDATEGLLTSRGRITHYECNDDGETGYLYNLNQTNKKSYVFLCYYRHGCKATISMDHEGRVMERKTDGHLPECVVNPYEYINRQARQQLCHHATKLSQTQDPQTLKSLYEEMRVSLMDSNKTSEDYVSNEKYKDFDSFESLKAVLGRKVAENRTLMGNPDDVSDLLGQINDPQNERHLSVEVNPGKIERFVLSGAMHSDGVCIILGTQAMFGELISQEIICVDGTFKVVPNILYSKRKK
jgi:hypothetical protein